MCAACGVDNHVPRQGVAGAATAGPLRFAALRNPNARPYLFGAGLAMMADNIEHVITYWVLWETFHSPALAGFQVISHWVPWLFSVYFGALADRYDCRRVIQTAQLLFMVISAAWGVLFFTGTLQIWHACVLLILHGIAGALWAPGEQLLLHDFVGPKDLPSAVRLNATFRSLGILLGPAVGSVLLLGLGATGGIFANILVYLPLTLFLSRTRFTGHSRDDGLTRVRASIADAVLILRRVGSDHTLISMITLAGLGSFFLGTALQAVMPTFAQDMGTIDSGLTYGVLLFAHGAGGVIGGFLMEATGRIKTNVPAAVVSTAVYAVSTLAFAATSTMALAVTLLVVGGVANLAAMSIGMTIVQLRAPAAERGRVIGVYNMFANGLRAGSGLTVGVFGAAIGVHWSLALSSLALGIGAVVSGLYARRGAVRASLT